MERKEIAFKLKHRSEMEKNYLTQQEEQQKFHDMATAFFNKYDFTQNHYIIGRRLRVELSDEESSCYANQIIKVKTQGCSQFKLKSKMQKLWEVEVIEKINERNLYCNSFWHCGIMEHGRYAMWEYGGTVYGYLCGYIVESLPDDMEQIKLSEYYKMIEKIEGL